MARTQTFQGLNARTWARVKATSLAEHGTRYDPVGADAGVAVTHTPVGEVAMAYAFDPQAQSVTYTIQKKPFFVGDGLIWSGIRTMIDKCRV
jgi:hypothetical protein